MDGYNMHRKAIKEALAELGIDERLVNNIGVIETLRQLLHKGAYESLAKEDIQKKIKSSENGLYFGDNKNMLFSIDDQGNITVEEMTFGLSGTEIVIDTFNKDGFELSHLKQGSKDGEHSFRVKPINKDSQIIPGLVVYDFTFAGNHRRRVFLDNGSTVFDPQIKLSGGRCWITTFKHFR